MAALPPDPTLDEMRAALAPAIAREAAFDGWGDAALARAAQGLGLDPGVAALAFPEGRIGMIDAWFAGIDEGMAAALPAERTAAMRVHERVRALLLARFALLLPTREAVRAALAILAQPQNAAAAARLGWRAADTVWRAAGDASADVSFYTRRTTLAAVYAATLLAWLNDESDGTADTTAFLDRRLAGVLRFERFKARLRPDPERRFSMARFLGRLRYPTS